MDIRTVKKVKEIYNGRVKEAVLDVEEVDVYRNGYGECFEMRVRAAGSNSSFVIGGGMDEVDELIIVVE